MKRTIKDTDVTQKRIVVRVDLDVPLETGRQRTRRAFILLFQRSSTWSRSAPGNVAPGGIRVAPA